MTTAHTSLINWLRDHPRHKLTLSFGESGQSVGIISKDKIILAIGSQSNYEDMCRELCEQIYK